jgi:hypothetical protein
LPCLPGITIGGASGCTVEPCCAATGATLAKLIARAIKTVIMKAPSAGILCCLPSEGVVITIQILRNVDTRSGLMILFARTFGKPINFAIERSVFRPTLKDEFARMMFQASQSKQRLATA